MPWPRSTGAPRIEAASVQIREPRAFLPAVNMIERAGWKRMLLPILAEIGLLSDLGSESRKPSMHRRRLIRR
ncbi:hypothetical protein DUT91_15180 [Phyllobacterium salinisoli]|uniref:Uncharacterized protein n=1 Tax=Phyllobacterium salinisoli TaxID=1899321 RepID=A0A368K4A2_9HYPH|nr:hypothetical protein DUT91_15180 [Phyllobacterium salinisoli]